MMKKLWNLLASVKLTIVLFILILIPAVAGTIVQQNAPDPARYVEIYGPVWSDIFRLLGLYDVYHDPRFVVLLVLLGMNTFVCTIKRFKPRWNRAGTMLTHFGLLFILVGAVIGAAFGAKGFMGIKEGETKNTINLGRATQETKELPFDVKLVDFILDVDEEPAQKLLIQNMQTGKQQSHKISEGATIPLSKPRFAGLLKLVGLKTPASGGMKVARILPNASVVTSIEEGPEQTGVAAMEFRIVTGEGEERSFALSHGDHPYVSRRTGVAVAYKKIAGGESVNGEIETAKSMFDSVGSLEISVPDTDSRKLYPVKVGARFGIDATDYAIEVLGYVPDFVILEGGRVASRSDHPHNPAIQVLITGPSEPAKHWIFAKFPTMHKTEEMPFTLKFNTNAGFIDAEDYLLVLHASGNAPVLLHMQHGELLDNMNVEQGEKVTIKNTSYAFVVDRFFQDAKMSRKVENHPGRPGRPALEISSGAGDTGSRMYLWEGVVTDIPGHKVLYRHDERIRDFYSILQIIENGNVVTEKRIEVNDPLRYGGYALYQSSYDQEGLTWSGLQVKKDPGVPIVYAGFVLQILGMIIIFYINPLIRKAKQSQPGKIKEASLRKSPIGDARGA